MRIEKVELHNDEVRVSLLSYGASIQSVETLDRGGIFGPIHLSLGSIDHYQDNRLNAYLGASVGRYANRIAQARFVLEGKEVVLAANEGPNQLHGGPAGFAHLNWQVLSHQQTAQGGKSIFGLLSADGDQGFPGNLSVLAVYELAGNSLRISYSATTDATTVVNLTNHGYWNLDGSSTIHEHGLTLHADQVLLVGEDGLPSQGLQHVQNTPFDFRTRTQLAEALSRRPSGFDHSYKLSGDTGQLRVVALLDSARSGRWMSVLTDQPALQLYTGNGLGNPFNKFGALCLETQLFPDTPNHPEFGSAVLRPGQEYRSVTELQFGAT
jgi:aldose 1-epimerase